MCLPHACGMRSFGFHFPGSTLTLIEKSTFRHTGVPETKQAKCKEANALPLSLLAWLQCLLLEREVDNIDHGFSLKRIKMGI